ncbi:MAG: hypothetical protein P8O03_10405 [Ilumatobacter sp.]|nr:hypothetical protein [Ilumatobacter sp.]
MTTEDQDPLWSNIRQAKISAFDARLFLERAGLQPAEALKWWEQYVMSGEAAAALAAGWPLDAVVRARELSLSIRDAIQFGEQTNLNPSEVLEWWQAGVHADEAVEALAAGWSLDDTKQRHPSVVQRIERRTLQREAAAARQEQSEAASRQKADAEYALWQKWQRRSLGLVLCADVEEAAVDFEIFFSGRTHWARTDEAALGHGDSLQECLSKIPAHAAIIEAKICEVRCAGIGPEEFLTASDAIAQFCHRQVVMKRVEMKHLSGRERLESRDLYSWFPSSPGVLIVRRTSVNDKAVLFPAVPEAWRSFVRHTDSIVSVGRQFLIPDKTGQGWEPIGYFNDQAQGIATADQILSGHQMD